MNRLLALVVLSPFLVAASCETKPQPQPPGPAPIPTVEDASAPVPEPPSGAGSRCSRAGERAIALGCPEPRQGGWPEWVRVAEHNEEHGIDMECEIIAVAADCAAIDRARRGDIR